MKAKIGWFLLLLAAPLVAQATIYRWTDAQGVIHFSDEPPGKRSKANVVTPGKGDFISFFGSGSPAAKSRKAPNKKVNETFTKPAPAVETLAAVAETQSETRRQSCENARQRLNQVRLARVFYEPDARGNSRLLTGEDKRIAERALTGEVEFWCRARG